MDAESYLKSHGWRGLGYSLDHQDRGLKKPLLVSQKVDVLGVGKAKHQAQSDQWWMRAFDESLKQIGTGQKTVLDSVRQNGIGKGGLYGFFVKGEALEGTISGRMTPDLPEDTFSTMAASKTSPSTIVNSNDATSFDAPSAADILAKALTNGVSEVLNPAFERKRKEHEPAKEVRKKRKLKLAEDARDNAKRKRETDIAEGTFDYEAEEKKRKEREINKLVKANIDKRLRAGEFGPILPHPNAGKGAPQKKFLDVETGKTLSYKGEKIKREKNKRVAKAAEKERLTRLIYPELLPPSLDSGATQEEVDEWIKAERETKRAKKEAKRAAEEEKAARLAAEKEVKRQDKLQRRKERMEQREKTALGLAALKAGAATSANPTAPSVPAEMSSEGAIENTSTEPSTDNEDMPDAGAVQPVTTNSESQLIVGDLTATSPADADFDLNADEIKLGVTKRGRTKKIPGVGAVDRYPTKAEKRQKKMECKAFEAGLTLEQYKTKLEDEQWERDAPERERIAEVQASRGGLNAKDYRRKIAQERDAAANAIYLATGKYPLPGNYDLENIVKSSEFGQSVPGMTNGQGLPDAQAVVPSAISVTTSQSLAESEPSLQDLSTKKRAQLAKRAEAKGETLEEYYTKRIAKKAKLNCARTEDGDNDVNGGMAFVVDMVGDSKLADQSIAPDNNDPTAPGFIVDTVGQADLQNAKSGDGNTLRWHPDMLGDRKVKDLSKDERRARLEWMRARRAARHAAKGHNPISKKERHKKRMEKKTHARNQMVYEILKESGMKENEKVDKEQLLNARRAAKRQLREQKRLKRNKVIHRKNERVTQRISVGKV